MRILIVRLGAMGDIVHTLPAVAALKRAFPDSHLCWAVEPRWAPLLEGNPAIDSLLLLNRRQWPSVRAAIRQLRSVDWDLAIDFQGLIKSAMVTAVSRARHIFGYHRQQLKEWPAAFFYHTQVQSSAAHIVDQHRELAAAAGALQTAPQFDLPEGRDEGTLPETPFVLACPIAGWPAKEWPLAHYAEVARLLEAKYRMPLVLNGHPAAESQLRSVPGVVTHISSIAGLIAATRRARAVIGVDSGPLHLAAALGKPGVAIYGPTDPARNGPYGGSLQVLRDGKAVTSYKRLPTHDRSMLAITPEMVFRRLEGVL